MGSQFKMRVHPNSENLHIKLLGDLDTNAIDMLALHIDIGSKKFRKLFIYTNDLTYIDNSSRDILKEKIATTGIDMLNLKFAGERAADIAPYPFQVI
jgi:hypothetical protein